MADNKDQILEREYTIPLRRHWFPARSYERTSKAIKAVKNFVAKHMKVEDRDVDKVKLDVYLNNELWGRGRASPPAKVKVKVRKENGIVTVTFAETPKNVAFSKIKHAKMHSKAPESKEESKISKDDVTPAKSEEAKKDESEKEKANAIAKEVEIKQDMTANKHTNKPEKSVHPQRMALKK